MHLQPYVRAATTGFAVFALSLTLTACGGDTSDTETTDTPTTSSGEIPSDEATGTETNNAADLPTELRDFPLPAKYTVQMAGSQGGATTAILSDIPGGWEQTKAFYEAELPKAGWTIGGDRPFVRQEGTELDASKGSAEVTVAITSTGDTTNLTINLIEQ